MYLAEFLKEWSQNIKYILPFKITKEEAIEKLRERLKKGKFVPKEIKDFKTEYVRGIYIPYWLFDIYYYDNQYLKGEHHKAKSIVTEYYIREAECEFEKLTCDASGSLNDESSKRLEPYELQDLRPFNAAYLSGFYSDMQDENKDKMRNVARKRAKEIFDKEVAQSTYVDNVKIIENQPKCNILKEEYALLPAWFLTFRYKEEAYTILVNGQTGKVVGTVPTDKKKLISKFIVSMLISSLISTGIAYGFLFLLETQNGNIGGFIIAWLMFIAIFIAIVCMEFGKIRKNRKLTQSVKTLRYVKNRQD